MGVYVPPLAPTWANLQNKPTTVAGYGIQDAPTEGSAAGAISNPGGTYTLGGIPASAKRVVCIIDSFSGTSGCGISLGSGINFVDTLLTLGSPDRAVLILECASGINKWLVTGVNTSGVLFSAIISLPGALDSVRLVNGSYALTGNVTLRWLS